MGQSKDTHTICTGTTGRAAERLQLPAAPATGGDEFPATAATTAGDESLQGAAEQQSIQPLEMEATRSHHRCKRNDRFLLVHLYQVWPFALEFNS